MLLAEQLQQIKLSVQAATPQHLQNLWDQQEPEH
jgi:hypothetical protein